MTDIDNATVPSHHPCYDCRRHLENIIMRVCGEPIRVLTTPPPPHPTPTPHPTNISKAMYADLFYMHVIHMHTFFSRTPTCSTRHAYAYLFQPYTDLFYMLYICIPFLANSRGQRRRSRCVWEVQLPPGLHRPATRADVCVCVHPHPDTTARSDIT